MATVRNTIRLQDQMTPVLRTIIKAMNSTMTAMAGVDHVGNTSFNRMRRDIQNAEAALEQFNSEASEIPTQANRSAAAFSGFKNPLVTAAALIYTIKNALAGIGNVTNIVDTFTLTTARLNLMNDELQTTAELQDAIFASAKRSRAEYDSTAASVAKMGLLAGDAFKNTQEIVSFSELMNKSFKIGGASIQEQTSGMYQLTQAMASGKLQGDEFRSIMENAPMLAQAIATYTGKTKGELKQMSADGVITADIIKGAMFAAAADINSKFKTIPMTFGDAMTNIKNEGLQAFQPVIEKLNQLANSPGFQQFTQNIVDGLRRAADWALKFIDDMSKVVSWVQQNWPLVQSVIVGALGGIAAAYAGARIAALLYAFAQGAVNMQLLILNARLLAVGALVAAAVILWNNWGVAGKILAIILGVLAGVILVATIAQYAFNTALWACPLVWIIALIIAVIAIIIVLVLWIMDLWKTNMDFKYGVIAIWNSILKFFDMVGAFFVDVWYGIQNGLGYLVIGFAYAKFGILKAWNAVLNFFDKVPIFFMKIGNGIANIFGNIKVEVLGIMESMINGAIDIINKLISAVNLIPGVSIDPIKQVTFAASAKAEEEASRQQRDANVSAAEQTAASKAAERDKGLQEDLDSTIAEQEAARAERAAKSAANWANVESKAAERAAQAQTDRASDEANLAAQKAKAEADKQKSQEQQNPATSEPDWQALAASAGNPTLNGGTLDKIKGDVAITDEDIKLLKDVAATEFINKYTTLRPEMTVTFGDVKETADVSQIMSVIEDMVEEAYASSLVNG
jgi:tape measure domain-containing protein